MADERKADEREARERLANEAITTMLSGMKAFFEGTATLHVEIAKPGVHGSIVRFVQDTPKS